MLSNDEWKQDNVPEIINGKNIADFIDPDIFKKLEELEAEEERLDAEGFYESDHDVHDSLDEEDEEAIKVTATKIRSKKKVIRAAHARSSHQSLNRSVIARPDRPCMKLSEITSQMKKDGIETAKLEARAKLMIKEQKAAFEAADREIAARKRKADDAMDVDEDGGWEDEEMDEDGDVSMEAGKKSKRAKGQDGKKVILSSATTPVDPKRLPRKDRRLAGIGNPTEEVRARRLQLLQQREPNRLAKAGEADRHIPTKYVFILLLSSNWI